MNLFAENASTPECLLTDITLQIPYELAISGVYLLGSLTELVIGSAATGRVVLVR